MLQNFVCCMGHSSMESSKFTCSVYVQNCTFFLYAISNLHYFLSPPPIWPPQHPTPTPPPSTSTLIIILGIASPGKVKEYMFNLDNVPALIRRQPGYSANHWIITHWPWLTHASYWIYLGLNVPDYGTYWLRYEENPGTPPLVHLCANSSTCDFLYIYFFYYLFKLDVPKKPKLLGALSFWIDKHTQKKVLPKLAIERADKKKSTRGEHVPHGPDGTSWQAKENTKR